MNITPYPEHEGPEIADVFEVGEAVAAISRSRQPVPEGEPYSQELLTGDVLRRTCPVVGNEACKAACQAPAGYDNFEKLCSDHNLRQAVDALVPSGLETLMVSVTGNEIGFADELPGYRDAGLVSRNSQGIEEIAGYNAFFARSSDKVALGSRLADCGYVTLDFQDKDGEQVIGFMHLTRPHMQGESALQFEVDGKPAGAFEYFIDQALKHYGADLDTVKARVVAATTSKNFHQTFKSAEHMEERFAGWLEQGFLHNLSNPDWQPGDPVLQSDDWTADYKEMVIWQVLRAGLKPEQLEVEGSIDPRDLELGHASHSAAVHELIPHARDLYVTYPKQTSETQ